MPILCSVDRDLVMVVERALATDRANNTPDNLEVLCISCHRRTHYYLGGSPLEKINRRRP